MFRSQHDQATMKRMARDLIGLGGDLSGVLS